jgi:hypothetical protein
MVKIEGHYTNLSKDSIVTLQRFTRDKLMGDQPFYAEQKGFYKCSAPHIC